jgi:hypothetical protein
MSVDRWIRWVNWGGAVAAVLCLVAAGCQRKTVLTGVATEQASTDQSTSQESGSSARPSPSVDVGPKKTDSVPNWIGDPRYLLSKEHRAQTASSTVEPGYTKSGGVEVSTPPQPSGAGMMPKGELSSSQRTPVRSAAIPPSVTEADMREVWIYMENASAVSGRLPPPVEVYAALVQAKAKSAELVRSGAIILTGARTRDSVWAFEVRALQQQGWVAGPGGVEWVNAPELRRRLNLSR